MCPRSSSLLLIALTCAMCACSSGDRSDPSSSTTAAAGSSSTLPPPSTSVSTSPPNSSSTTPPATGFPAVAGGDFAARGPYSTLVESNAGPGNAFTLYYPRNLGTTGLSHPVVTWGNGTGATPVIYDALLDSWASHGFVVVASNSPNTGTGQEMLQGIDWLLSENARAGSTFFATLAVDAIGAAGHSQGGGGSINAGTDARIKTVLAIQPAPGDVTNLKGTLFVIAGTDDTIVSASGLVEPRVVDPSPVPTVYGLQQGADHFAPIGGADSMRYYLTAWLRHRLMSDGDAEAVFRGADAGILKDPDWTVLRKRFP
jgi:hypothetical protein